MIRNLFIALIRLSLILGSGYLNAIDTISLSESIPLNKKIITPYFYDTSGNLSILEIEQEFLRGNNVTKDFLASKFNPNKGHYWMYVTLKNKDQFDNTWIFSFDKWPIVELFEKLPDGQFSIKVTGFMIPYLKRDYPFANNNHISVKIPANDVKSFFIKLAAGTDHTLEPSTIAFDIRPQKQQDLKNHRDELIITVFATIFGILFLYNIFIWFSVKDIQYLYYLGIILTSFYTVIANSGYNISIFRSFENFPIWRGILESLSSGLSMIFMILFTTHLLNTKRNFPIWYKAFKISFFIILILIIGVNIHFQFFGPITALFGAIFGIMLLIIGIKSWKKKIPSSGYYLLAYSFTVLGIIIIALALGGVIPSNEYTFNYLPPTGRALEMLFFSFALANKINILQQESDNQKKEIITYLEEKELIQKNISIELEKKVTERTQEVLNQKEIIEEERKKSEELLLNILPEASIKELKETGKSTPRNHEMVSIIFVDFKGFTMTAASIPSDQLINELNEIFYRFDEIIEQNKIEKIKTIGDAYLAVSGLFDNERDHALRAVKAAIEIHQFLENRNGQTEIEWNVRVGIHSGSVVSGIVGKKKFAFDIWGDAVNVASRLETASEINQINVSAATYDLIKDNYLGIYRGKIEAKGKGEIDMYYILF